MFRTLQIKYPSEPVNFTRQDPPKPPCVSCTIFYLRYAQMTRNDQKVYYWIFIMRHWEGKNENIWSVPSGPILVPQVVPPRTVVWAERALERLEPRVGSLVLEQAEPAVESLPTARLLTHMPQVLHKKRLTMYHKSVVKFDRLQIRHQSTSCPLRKFSTHH